MSDIERLPVALGQRSYEILVGGGLLADAARHLRPVLRGDKVMIVTDRTVAAVGFVAVGFGCSSIYPLVMSMVGRFFAPRHQSMVIGFATTGGGVGSLLFPFTMALVAQQVGIRQGYLLYVVVSALIVSLAIAAIVRTRRTAASGRL